MLIFSKAPLFLWAKAVNTASYTQNCSLIRLRYKKTPDELMHDKEPDLSFLHVFGSLCYPTNDSEDLGKLNAKADIVIFVGYAPVKKAFRIYNRRTQKIIETIHVTFDELTTMASEQFGSGLGLQLITPATSSSGLITNPITQQPCNPPNRDDWDRLFQPMFDEYFNPSTIAVSPVPVAVAPRAVDIADSLVSTSIDQDAPSTNLTSQGSSSNVRPTHTPFEHLGRWTKDHPIANVIGDPSRYVSIRKQLKTDAMWCYFNAFLTSIELKNFKKDEEGIDFEESFAPVTRIEAIRLQISQSPRGIFLNQSKYAYEIIKKYGLLTSDSVDKPVVEKNKLHEDLQETPVNATLYRGMIGSLMYLTSCRPDLIYAVYLCARYQAKPTEKHLNAVKRIFRYLKGTINMGLWYSKNTAGLPRSKRAERYRIPLYRDNKSAIALCCNNVQHSRAKHIDVRYHFIKEQVEKGIVELYFVQMEYQLADIFTKPLPRERFNFLIEKLDMRSMSPKTLNVWQRKRTSKEMKNYESCVKCVDLDAELLNKQNANNDLSKSY
ncbi:integrase, catalytic region, zinc finger, CCHC-type containing protein [Tanacetum coccineum]